MGLQRKKQGRLSYPFEKLINGFYFYIFTVPEKPRSTVSCWKTSHKCYKRLRLLQKKKKKDKKFCTKPFSTWDFPLCWKKYGKKIFKSLDFFVVCFLCIFFFSSRTLTCWWLNGVQIMQISCGCFTKILLLKTAWCSSFVFCLLSYYITVKQSFPAML